MRLLLQMICVSSAPVFHIAVPKDSCSSHSVTEIWECSFLYLHQDLLVNVGGWYWPLLIFISLSTLEVTHPSLPNVYRAHLLSQYSNVDNYP